MDGVPGRPPQLHDLADVHYSRSVACQQYQRGIATVVLPNRAAGIDAGGSGAAGVRAGPRNPPEVERRVPARALQVPG